MRSKGKPTGLEALMGWGGAKRGECGSGAEKTWIVDDMPDFLAYTPSSPGSILAASVESFRFPDALAARVQAPES